MVDSPADTLPRMSKGWNADDITDQTGRTAVVTGGNSGIGLITARELLRARSAGDHRLPK